MKENKKTTETTQSLPRQTIEWREELITLPHIINHFPFIHSFIKMLNSSIKKIQTEKTLIHWRSVWFWPSERILIPTIVFTVLFD